MREPEGGGAEAVAVEERLRYQREVLVNFRNSTYQWISPKLFTLPADVDYYTVLQLLIGHVRYRDSYGGTGDRDMEIIHGPYWLYAISPEAFSPASAADAETLLRTWAEYAAPLPEGRRQEMELQLYPRIRHATRRYLLPDLRDIAEHDWGGSVGSVTGFLEDVLIDRRTDSVALVVASDD
jgi:hypothetical protein